MDNIKYTTSAQAFEKYANDCLKGHEGAAFHVAESPCVWVGKIDTAYNKDECNSRRLPIAKGQYYAGAIVCMPGDVSACITTDGLSDVGMNISDAIFNYLFGKGINVIKDGNDILADGKKVASYCQAETPNGLCQTVVHVSVGKMDLDLVKAICAKPMLKTPGALSDYGISTKDIIDLISNGGLI